ncbi:MAG: 3',5'-cyclic adenosine monophosphate phosphodiesterase CpdA [Candidatus Anoxychlamydiales bacterium]|nr:3',5'-cyclic adenosine monophosphate phosphodiesterase CpdA [Candidatus Anoxychlamydiales bacterium]
MIKIAHISDLHFSKVSFFPIALKRFVGVTNLLINRRKSYIEDHLYKLPTLLKSLDIDHIFITGDLTSTSLEKEFEKAKDFIDLFDKKNKFFIIPGNHDTYTKKAYKDELFYQFFKKTNISKMIKSNIQIHELSDKWVYIGLDTTVPTSLFSCSGLFSKELENSLIETLDKIPKDTNIILTNHFPLFLRVEKRNGLNRRKHLLAILKKYKNIKLYLYGHTHKWTITKKENYPYMICSGCSSHKKKASFNTLQIEDNKCIVTSYSLKNNNWQKDSDKILSF